MHPGIPAQDPAPQAPGAPAQFSLPPETWPQQSLEVGKRVAHSPTNQQEGQEAMCVLPNEEDQLLQHVTHCIQCHLFLALIKAAECCPGGSASICDCHRALV